MKKSNGYLALLIGMLVVMMMSGCTSSRTTVSHNVDLAKYQYASIINNDTYHIPAELLEYEIQLFDAIDGSRLKLVSDARIHTLSQQEQEKLLLVKWGVSVKPEESMVVVSVIDYLTGRPVASCRGTYTSLGIAGASYDLSSAIKKTAKQVSETFPKSE